MNWLKDRLDDFAMRLWHLVIKGTQSIKDSRQRGDVPGWVLVLLMTVGLVTVMWAVAGPKLTALLSGALDSVSRR